jgi:hypothetical protein
LALSASNITGPGEVEFEPVCLYLGTHLLNTTFEISTVSSIRLDFYRSGYAVRLVPKS